MDSGHIPSLIPTPQPCSLPSIQDPCCPHSHRKQAPRCSGGGLQRFSGGGGQRMSHVSAPQPCLPIHPSVPLSLYLHRSAHQALHLPVCPNTSCSVSPSHIPVSHLAALFSLPSSSISPSIHLTVSLYLLTLAFILVSAQSFVLCCVVPSLFSARCPCSLGRTCPYSPLLSGGPAPYLLCLSTLSARW